MPGGPSKGRGSFLAGPGRGVRARDTGRAVELRPACDLRDLGSVGLLAYHTPCATTERAAEADATAPSRRLRVLRWFRSSTRRWPVHVQSMHSATSARMSTSATEEAATTPPVGSGRLALPPRPKRCSRFGAVVVAPHGWP